MKKVNWTAVVIFAILALLVLQVAGYLLGGSRYGGWGMMGPGMMGSWGYSPFGWIGMFFMWLIPIGVIALIVFGVVSLARNSGNPTPPALHNPCPNCGKGTQAEWQNCPYCGTKLK